MKNNLFEKNIQSKLEGIEIPPSDGLFEKTMKKRALGHQKSLMPFYFKSIAVVLFIGAAVFAAWYTSDVDSTNNIELSDNQILAEPNVLNQESENEKFVSEMPNSKSSTDLPVVKNKISAKHTVVSKPQKDLIVSKPLNNESVIVEKPNNINSNIEDNGEDIFQRYFNAASSNKPSILKESHQGNSHLYVFHSMDESMVDAVFINNIKVSRIKKLRLDYPISSYSQVDNNTDFVRNAKTSKPIFIDVFGIGVVSKGMPYQGDLASIMKQGSEQTYSNGFGFRFIMPLKDRWSVFSGLNVLTQNSKYKFAINQTTQEKEVKLVTRYINDPILGIVPFQAWDTIEVSKTNSQNHDLRNKYTLIQLPIGLSYQTAYKKISLGFNLSTVLNLTSQSQVMYLDDSKVLLKNSNTKSLSMSHAFGLQLGYDLNSKWKVFAEPSLQFLTINGKKVGSNVNERFLNKQLSVGLRYSLF
jgi:hypothetical protein